MTAHHPLREAGTQGTALTRNGQKAMTELAERNVLAVLSGHVHDAFDLTQETVQGPVKRMIGAGTLSRRLRSTQPSLNELRWDGEQLAVSVRNLEGHDTPEMLIDEVPEDATPPRKPDEPVDRSRAPTRRCTDRRSRTTTADGVCVSHRIDQSGGQFENASVRRRDRGVGFGGTGVGRVNNPDAGRRTWTRPD